MNSYLPFAPILPYHEYRGKQTEHINVLPQTIHPIPKHPVTMALPVWCIKNEDEEGIGPGASGVLSPARQPEKLIVQMCRMSECPGRNKQ
jgi:hypothetical protein